MCGLSLGQYIPGSVCGMDAGQFNVKRTICVCEKQNFDNSANLAVAATGE